MKNHRRINLNARLFTQALQSALGTGSSSRKDQIASKENLQVAEAPANDWPNIPRLKSTEEMAPSFGNLNQIANDVVGTNSALLTNELDPQPWVENNHLSTIQETWYGNVKIPADQAAYSTYSLQEIKSAEDLSPNLNIPNHLEINDNEYNLPVNHFESSPNWITDPSDVHNWLENNRKAAFQETLCKVPENENDAWLRKNRLMALQQLGSNTLGQNSTTTSLSPPYTNNSTGKRFPDMVQNLPGCWVRPTISPHSSTNSLSSESNSLKDMPVYDGKYKFESSIIHQREEWSKERIILKDPKSTQKNSDFPSEEQAVCKNAGRAELAAKNRSNFFGKSPQLQHPLVKNSKSERSSINCCKTFHDKPSAKNAAKLPKYHVKSLMTLESKTGFYDSHCHLDLLFNRNNFQGTYADYMAEHKDTYPKSYNGCIAVFCKPFTFAKDNLWKDHLAQNNVWGAFGCHPKSAGDYDDRIEKDLEAALDHPKVKALGEIGLDYSKGNKCPKETQHKVFRKQLRIAERRKLPLVIHCRDADEDTIKIMHEIVPKDKIFHLHCFTGNWEKAQMWIREFKNVFIGLTNLVTFPSAVETHEVARKLSLDYLLLETDAPYFVPSMVSKSTSSSHPGMAIHVAAQIAALKGIPVERVLLSTSANTRTVYNLP